MATRAAQCLRLLCVGRNFRSSYLLASSGCVSSLQGALWSKPQAFGRLGVRANGWRYYSAASSGDEGEDGKEEGRDEGMEEDEFDAEMDNDLLEEHLKEMDQMDLVGIRGGQQHAIAPVSIPDIFPEVPVLPVSRNPLFPKFVKLLEVRGCNTRQGIIWWGRGGGAEWIL